MSPRRRPATRRTHVVAGLLIATVALVGLLAVEATRAARAERRTAEAVLRDYASLAAWQYGQALRQSIGDAIGTRIESLSSHESSRGWPLPGAADTGCGCPDVQKFVSAFFHADLGTGTWRTWGEPVGDDLRRLVAADPVKADGVDTGLRLTLLEANEGRRILAWRLPRRSSDPVHGLLAEAALLDSILETAAARATLLPPALVDPAEARRLVALEIGSPGAVLRRDSVARSPFTAREDLGPAFGHLVAEVALAPEAASRLIIGGLPTSRLPWLYALAAVAVLLTGVALVQVRREAQLVRLRGEFISGVSHELRTPLAQIRMFAETLQLGRVRSDAERSRSLDIILQESRRLSRLVDNVLAFSRSERQSIALARERVNVAGLVGEVVDGMHPVAQAAGATLRRSPSDDAIVTADAGALRQVLINLVDNAIKYGPAGQAITAGATTSGDVVRLWVEDEGPGVAPEHRAHVWQPFWRGPGSPQGGSGIGLAIVAELVALHGGRAYVESAAPGGARFVVELPVAAPATDESLRARADHARQPA